jgi:Ca-activated chloride channel family protein
MRRAVLCCALLAVAVVGCSSSATSAPYSNGNNAPVPPAPAASAAPAYPWPTGFAQATSQLPYPPVVFPSVGTNPYVDTTQDQLSTFGLDVDTASYTVARNYISQGMRPNSDSVRPEEWVNYFDQGYGAPETGTFAIHTDGGPNPFLSPNEVLLRVGVKARDAYSGRRPAAALTFVIDVSGSMGGEGRLDMVKQSLALLASQLRSDDRLAIVAFSTDARTVLESTSGSDRGAILSALARLQPENSTNTEAGLRLGYELERRQFIKGGIDRVILATDGVANEGNTDPNVMLDEVGAGTSSDIQMVAVGVGTGNYNDALLEQLADKGEGYYAFIDNIDEARRVFVDRLMTTLDTVAVDAKAQIDFDPQVVAGYRLIGYEDRAVPDQSFRSSSTTGDAIGAGHQVTALYALYLRQGWEGPGNARIATVTLRWTDPISHRATEMSQDFYRADLATSFGSADPHFKLDSLVAATAEVLRNSPWIPGYGVHDLQIAAAELAPQLPQTAEVKDFVTMIDQIKDWG